MFHFTPTFLYHQTFGLSPNSKRPSGKTTLHPDKINDLFVVVLAGRETENSVVSTKEEPP